LQENGLHISSFRHQLPGGQVTGLPVAFAGFKHGHWSEIKCISHKSLPFHNQH
jgi:hypothetical protein